MRLALGGMWSKYRRSTSNPALSSARGLGRRPGWRASVLAALLATALGGSASAQQPAATGNEPVRPFSRPGGWLLNGAALGVGRSAVEVELGWPGVFVSGLYGYKSDTDLGGFAGFQYSFEGFPDRVYPGVRLGAIARRQLYTAPGLNVGVKALPSLNAYFPGGIKPNLWGFGVRAEADVGFVVHPQLSLNVSLATPMALYFTDRLRFILPLEPGASLEFRSDENLSLLLSGQVGPSWEFMTQFSPRAHVTFSGLIGVGYRL